jgi:transcriptional regulator with XRE-family HTH domain
MLRIRYWRKRKGLSLKALSEKTGIPLKMLSKYELGTVDPPSSKLIPIAAGLGVPVGRLYPMAPKDSPDDTTRNGASEVPTHA